MFQPLAGLTNQPLVRLSISGTPLPKTYKHLCSITHFRSPQQSCYVVQVQHRILEVPNICNYAKPGSGWCRRLPYTVLYIEYRMYSWSTTREAFKDEMFITRLIFEASHHIYQLVTEVLAPRYRISITHDCVKKTTQWYNYVMYRTPELLT